MQNPYRPEKGMAERLAPIAVRSWFGEELTSAVESWNIGATELAGVRQQQAQAEGLLRAAADVAISDIVEARDTAYAARHKGNAIEISLREQLVGLFGEIRAAIIHQKNVCNHKCVEITEGIAERMVGLGFSRNNALRALAVVDCANPELLAAQTDCYQCETVGWDQEEASNQAALLKLVSSASA